MSYVIPKPLTKGDTISIIAPSGPILDKEPIMRGKEFLESEGYNVVLSEHIFGQDRYLSASDTERLEDLHKAFADKNIDTIICARGGYGALRLIEKIDYKLIRQNPKNFCGYSDITILSAMFLKRANLITYSSPMIKGDFGAKPRDEYTMDSFFKAVTHQKQELTGNKIHKSGAAQGIIWGGNLASLVSMAGMDFIPDEGFIFFAEDLGEPVYKIDKMFTQLMNIEKFKSNIKGMVLGKFLDVEYPDQLDYLFDQISEELNIPTVSGFKISHEDTKATIPYGANGILNKDKLII